MTCFNPRARAGRDSSDAGSRSSCAAVSIHAPARGATSRTRGVIVRIHAVSIHAPARGATVGARGGERLDTCFNPRARAGRDHAPYDCRSVTSHSFNPRARAGRDVAMRMNSRAYVQFQSTRPRGARPLNAADAMSTDSHVSIHAPARGATQASGEVVAIVEFQSTRPRGARPAVPIHRRGVVMFQSTRPRGARPVSTALTVVNAMMFQSTRPRGARRNLGSLVGDALLCFNPRARAGRDEILDSYDVEHCHVSIHAPARGATEHWTSLKRMLPSVSIHAPARGATYCPTDHVAMLYMFQSTRPRGARRAGRMDSSYSVTGFNPRARAGRDPVEQLYSHGNMVSIHAPARGATSMAIDISSRDNVFQSTRPRGARLLRRPAVLRRQLVSIHAPARGATSKLSDGFVVA